MNKLMPFQGHGVQFLSYNRHALLADEMGLGKTIQAIGAINRVNARKVLIICPATIKYNWRRELRKWLSMTRNIQIINKTQEFIYPETDIVIINYDLVIKKRIWTQLRKRKFAVGICDEAHYLKNMESKRTMAVLSKIGVLRQCVFKWMITGTPILNRPIELYPMLKTLAPELIKPYDTFTKFALRYCAAYEDRFGLNTRGASNLPELKNILKKFMLRRLKKDVLPELPERILQKIELEPSKEVLKVIEEEEQLSADLREKYEDGEFTELGELSRLRRRTAIAKLPECIEFIKEVLETKEKIVIFAYHREVMAKLHAQLIQYGPVCLTGSTRAVDRQGNILKFINDNRYRIFLGQIQAAGQGIDGLQNVCDHIIFVESSWVPGQISQAVDRCHRIGQKNSVLAQFLVSAGTIESTMLDSVLEKNKVIKDIVN